MSDLLLRKDEVMDEARQGKSPYHVAHRLVAVGSMLIASTLLLLGCASRTDCPACEPPQVPMACPEAPPLTAEAMRDVLTFTLRRDAEPPQLLFLSGGGWRGAWGAGILNGWTLSGERPEFQIVTGVSTGALMSTFAFLGPDYDATLQRLYTQLEDKDIFRNRFILSLPFSSSLKNTAPLRALIARHLTDAVIRRVADQRHRALLVGTVNLDTSEFTVWDLTKMAREAERDPRCFEKYRRVVQASASIPVLFPPVDLDGALHADGGTRQNVFAETAVPQLRRRFLSIMPPDTEPVTPTAYVIVNGKLVAEKQCVDDRVLKIGVRSIDLLTTEVLIGNLLRLEDVLEAGGSSTGEPWAFRLSRIPEDYCLASDPRRFIDTEAMKQLFKRGVEWGKTRPWASDIPDNIAVSPLPCQCNAPLDN